MENEIRGLAECAFWKRVDLREVLQHRDTVSTANGGKPRGIAADSKVVDENRQLRAASTRDLLEPRPYWIEHFIHWVKPNVELFHPARRDDPFRCERREKDSVAGLGADGIEKREQRFAAGAKREGALTGPRKIPRCCVAEPEATFVRYQATRLRRHYCAGAGDDWGGAGSVILRDWYHHRRRTIP